MKPVSTYVMSNISWRHTSSGAVSKLSRSVGEIFAFECGAGGVLHYNAPFLSNAEEYRHKSQALYTITVDYWSCFRCRQWVPSLQRTLPSEPPKFTKSLCENRPRSIALWKVFRYLEPFRRDSRVWRTEERTDGRTDIHVANAALNYVARPKIQAAYTLFNTDLAYAREERPLHFCTYRILAYTVHFTAGWCTSISASSMIDRTAAASEPTTKTTWIVDAGEWCSVGHVLQLISWTLVSVITSSLTDWLLLICRLDRRPRLQARRFVSSCNRVASTVHPKTVYVYTPVKTSLRTIIHKYSRSHHLGLSP